MDPSASEVTVSIVAGPQVSAWLEQLQGAVTRVKSSKDAEAVHDLRVTLRRTRSLLRVVRTVYGQFHVNLIRVEFKRVADATSALRDAEVLRETLGLLEMDDATKKKPLPPSCGVMHIKSKRCAPQSYVSSTRVLWITPWRT